jgi:hypothetical protein
MNKVSGRDPSGQALAVPVEPVARLDHAGFDPSRWHTVDTLPRGKRVLARTCRGEIIEGRTLGKSNQVRDSNTVTDKDGFRHPVTHWRLK